MKQIALDENWVVKPEKVSFVNDIFPILYRVTQYKWLNDEAELDMGHYKRRRLSKGY